MALAIQTVWIEIATAPSETSIGPTADPATHERQQRGCVECNFPELPLASLRLIQADVQSADAWRTGD